MTSVQKQGRIILEKLIFSKCGIHVIVVLSELIDDEGLTNLPLTFHYPAHWDSNGSLTRLTGLRAQEKLKT